MRLWTTSIAPQGRAIETGFRMFRYSLRQLIKSPEITLTAGRLACARHWSDYGGIKRDLCRADQPLSYPFSDRIVR